MPTEFYFNVQQYNFDWINTNSIFRRIAVTETLETVKSDSNQCYSELELSNENDH